VAAGFLVVIAFGCLLYFQYRMALQSARQAFTLGTLKTIVRKLEDKQEVLGRPLGHNEIEETVLTCAQGLDDWGHRVVVVARPGPEGQRYAVVSPGSDGIFEHQDLLEYFDVPKADIHGLAERDIVIVDSSVRTLAGK
jgi:hypothetical protein